MTAEQGTRPLPKWFTETDDNHSQWYVERMRSLARDGHDLAGEARFMHALLPPRSRIIDGGCGPGRVAGALHDLGHEVLGVDVDPVLIDAARADFSGVEFRTADLTALAADLGDRAPYDAAVLAGNVMAFMADGTQAEALRQLASVVDGPIVLGFGTGRGYTLDQCDADAAAAGLRVDLRLGTWDLRPATDESDFHITVLRR